MSARDGVPGPVAVTGARGRLGRALLELLTAQGRDVVAWIRPEYNLEDAASAERLMARDRPALVFHAAA